MIQLLDRRAGTVLALVLAACNPPRADIGFFAEGLTVCARGSTVNGVDVSHYQGTIDWNAAHGAGTAFAFMKATEGTAFVDPQFATNWSGAGAAGVVRGAYHFFHPATDAVMQADFFVRTAGMTQNGDLPLTIDLEVTDGLSGAQVAQGALAFLARVMSTTGRTPIVYTSASFMSSLSGTSGFSSYTLWVANWQVSCPTVPSPTWTDWTFWQNSDSGSVAGISGAVDTNVFNGALSDLHAFTNQGSMNRDMGGGHNPDLAGAPKDGGDDAGSTGNPGVDGGRGPGSPGGCSYVVPTPGASLPAVLILLVVLAAVARRRPLLGR